MGKQKRHYEKRVSRVFLSFLATKISLYGETEQHYQKTCMLSDIHQNAKMQSKAWGKEKILQVTYLLSVL